MFQQLFFDTNHPRYLRPCIQMGWVIFHQIPKSNSCIQVRDTKEVSGFIIFAVPIRGVKGKCYYICYNINREGMPGIFQMDLSGSSSPATKPLEINFPGF
jgi:hypothetical protein